MLKKSSKFKFLKLCVAVFLAMFFALLACMFFKNPVGCRDWDSTLQRCLYPYGYVVRWRQEGFGNSFFGKYSINGTRDITSDENEKLLFWGDSMVEALHVSDKYKMHSVFNSKLQSIGSSVKAYSLGSAGQDIAAYYFQIKEYEKLVTNINCHFIVISSFDDVHPNTLVSEKQTAKPALLLKPQMHFIRGKRKPISKQKIRIKSFLAKYRLQFFKLIFIEIFGSKKAKKLPVWESIDFTLGKASLPLSATNLISKEKRKHLRQLRIFWDEMLTVFKSASTKPMIFVYLPNVPNIKRNQVFFEDELNEESEIFEQSCKKAGIGFVDAYSSFNKVYRDSFHLPRGFNNTRPGNGHLNKFGHAAVAEAVFNYYIYSE